MAKIIWTILIALIVIIAGWYLVSPAFKVVESDEKSPLFSDLFEKMDSSIKAEFEKETSEMADVIIEMNDDMMGAASVVSMGHFRERAHEVSGKALLIEDRGKNILRFEDFETINGPNLHIYLSSSLGADDFIDLGKIKATKGNVNYELPDGIDTAKYDKVLVWCVPFRVLFSYAELD